MMIDTFTVDSGVIQIGPGRNLVNIDVTQSFNASEIGEIFTATAVI